MKKLLSTAVVTVLVAVLGGTGMAHTQFALDPDDSPGPMDIVTARLAHKVDDGKPTIKLRLVTYETWTYESIDDRKQFVSFEIDVPKDRLERGADRCVVVQAHTEPAEPGTDPALGYSANVYKNCMYFGDDLVKSYGMERVTIPDAHSIQVQIPKRVLVGSRADSYRWRAVTSFEEPQQSSVCPSPGPHDGGYGACADFTKWQRHK